MPKSHFQKRLEGWYQKHKRDLPWRQTKDPYYIWLSEIMLQQTRVDQGLPYYQKFVENYPTVHDLARAPEDNVLKDWEGLGYYSRARNLHFTAKHVSEELDGIFPGSYSELLKLKGIGDYTAAAVSSMSFDEVQPVVDGNVFRVLARYLGIDKAINSTEGKKAFKEAAWEMLDREDPGLYNQAIMEFGALQCVPKSPDCSQCPLQENCSAFLQGKVGELPHKIKKKYNRERFFNYFIIKKKNEVLVSKREESDIWKGLFEFPLVERMEDLEEDFAGISSFLGYNPDFTVRQRALLKPHKLSHQTIYITVWQLELSATEDHIIQNKRLVWQPTDKLGELAFPRPLRKFLDEKQLLLPFG